MKRSYAGRCVDAERERGCATGIDRLAVGLQELRLVVLDRLVATSTPSTVWMRSSVSSGISAWADSPSKLIPPSPLTTRRRAGVRLDEDRVERLVDRVRQT